MPLSPPSLDLLNPSPLLTTSDQMTIQLLVIRMTPSQRHPKGDPFLGRSVWRVGVSG